MDRITANPSAAVRTWICLLVVESSVMTSITTLRDSRLLLFPIVQRPRDSLPTLRLKTRIPLVILACKCSLHLQSNGLFYDSFWNHSLIRLLSGTVERKQHRYGVDPPQARPCAMHVVCIARHGMQTAQRTATVILPQQMDQTLRKPTQGPLVIIRVDTPPRIVVAPVLEEVAAMELVVPQGATAALRITTGCTRLQLGLL